MTDWSLLGFEHISQTSKSEILWQFLQKFTFNLISEIAFARFLDWDSGCLNRKRTKRNADFLPIPGKFEISLTAFSINFEENYIKQTYKF